MEPLKDPTGVFGQHYITTCHACKQPIKKTPSGEVLEGCPHNPVTATGD